MRISTLDIAAKVGFSRSTVCNVLGDKHSERYSPKTRRKIIEVAEELGYREVLMANAIKKPLKHIGFAASGVASLETPFMKEILIGIHRATMEEGYLLMVIEPSVSTSKKSLELEQRAGEVTEKLINLVSSKVLDGLIVDKAQLGVKQMELLEKANIPFVLINSRIPGQMVRENGKEYRGFEYEKEVSLRSYWVSIDHVLGGKRATEHLLNYGHRRIAVLHPDTSDYPVGYSPVIFSYQLIGYKAALQNASVEVDTELFLNAKIPFINSDEILAKIDAMMSLAKPPTAIFTVDDTIANFLMHYFHSKGMKVPEDISIIGYGNLSSAVMTIPRLTTVNVPWARMGEQGLKMLVSLLNSNSDNIRSHHVDILEPIVIDGGTVAAPNKIRVENYKSERNLIFKK